MWYTQSFSGSWFGTYKPGLAKIESRYLTWFGSNNNGLRKRISEYITKAQQVCHLDDMDFVTASLNSLNKCKDMVENAKKDFESMKSFANAYLEMASKLLIFASQSVAIMQTSSFCDPAKFNISVINENCAWNPTLDSLLSQVFFTQSRALFLSKVMKEIAVECDPSANQWPFSQICSQNTCNYHHGFAVPEKFWENQMASTNEEGIFVKLGQGLSAALVMDCRAKKTEFSSLGFGSGGITVTGVDPYLQSDDSCDLIDEYFRSVEGNVVYGAIPQYLLQDPFPRCAALIRDENLWGPSFRVSAPFYEYPTGFECDLSDPSSNLIAYDLPESANQTDCSQKCSSSGTYNGVFFMTMSSSTLAIFPFTRIIVCRCFQTW
jgi:hypothetical protein